MATASLSRAAAASLDDAVEAAILAGTPRGLPVIGFGEVTLVLAWPPDDPRWAVKRLPVFGDAAQLAVYGVTLEDYVAVLEGRGVETVPTSLIDVPGPRATRRAFLVQPLSDPADLLSTVLLDASPGRAAELLDHVVTAVLACVDDRVGLDAQVSNWVVTPHGTLRYLDLSTPFLRDDGDHDRLDVELMLSVYPAALRPLLARWVVPGILRGYHDPVTVLVDVGANLLREELDRHLPVLIALAGERGVVLDEVAVRGYWRQNLRTWRLLRTCKRLDRAWQRTVRRRAYPFLLPETTGRG